VLRVIADTNVYVSALHVAGVADEVLAGARAGQFQPFISLPILQELERMLAGKLKWAPGRAKEAISAVRKLATLVVPTEAVAAIPNDDPANRILACALRAEAQIIVTGDRLLHALGSFRGITVVSPRQFLDALAPESPQG